MNKGYWSRIEKQKFYKSLIDFKCDYNLMSFSIETRSHYQIAAKTRSFCAKFRTRAKKKLDELTNTVFDSSNLLNQWFVYSLIVTTFEENAKLWARDSFVLVLEKLESSTFLKDAFFDIFDLVCFYEDENIFAISSEELIIEDNKCNLGDDPFGDLKFY